MHTYRSAIESHLREVQKAIIKRDDPVWPSVIDVRTKTFPLGEHIPQRVYRLIGAPRGSTLYWDQPQILAAYACSRITNDPSYAQAADAYVDAFLSACVTDDGMFQWGNHQYYDVFEQRVITFHNGYHELRPITPAWDVFWRHDPVRTERYIRRFSELHIYDPSSGGFNRHDDQKKDHAFIESGGIIVESLAWLYSKTGDEELLRRAISVASYSYSHRGHDTGLLRNEPDHGRWDSLVATTETGVWAQSLLRAFHYSGNGTFQSMAADVVRAYIQYGFSKDDQQFYGQLHVDTGRPVIPETSGYWPGRFTNAWNTTQWPAHDYPMAFGEACLHLFSQTGDAAYKEAAQRMAAALMHTRPQTEQDWAYAESYGRCMHFLCHAAQCLDTPSYIADAQVLAHEAHQALFTKGLYQGYHHAGVHEAVDGVGYLLLSLLYLENNQEPKLDGFGF